MARSATLPLLKTESGLAHYLAEIRRFPMLEPQEEYMLAKRWREHGDTEAAHKLVTSHLRLVAKIAMGYRGYGLPISEVVSEGNVGLMQAVKRFEPEKGFRLATYAMWWIRASIQEYILRSWSLVKMGTTANQKKLFFNLRKAKSKINALDEGDLRPDQTKLIAKRLGVTEQDVVDMNRRLGGDASLNAPIRDDGDSGEWQDWLVDNSPSQQDVLEVEPHAHDRAVEDQPHDRLFGQRTGVPGVPVGLHLAPHPAHRVLAHRAAEQRRERPAYPPCVGAGEIAARDQRVGGKRAPLVSPQRLALPLRRLAVGGVQPGARHRDLDRAERAGQRPRPAAVAVAGNVRTCFIAGHLASPVTRPGKHRVELAADQLFDEVTRPSPHRGLDRIKPVVEKINSHLGCRLRRIRLRGMARHGVVSSPTLQRRMNSRLITPETTPPQFLPTQRRHQSSDRNNLKRRFKKCVSDNELSFGLERIKTSNLMERAMASPFEIVVVMPFSSST